MYPDYLIYEDLRRQQQKWEPVPLELPLNIPLSPCHDVEEDVDGDDEPRTGVVIIDMEDYTEYEV